MANMRSVVLAVSLLAVALAEAPYNLPRPAPNQPTFNYPSGPSLPQVLPQPLPSLPRPLPQQLPQPQPNFPQFPVQQFSLNTGYNYQQPNLPQFSLPQRQPQPLPSLPSPAPLPLPNVQPLLPSPQQIVSIPSPSYGVPQQAYRPPVALPQPQIQPQPQLRPQPQFQPQPLPNFPATPYVQQSQFGQQGYNYQQPQFFGGSGQFSSYQADTNQYQQGFQNDVLDSTVVGRVQNIIREDEHNSARNRGYQSLVSGVQLEGARPSIEVTNFVQRAPLSLPTQQFPIVNQGFGLSLQGSSFSGPSVDYGLPNLSFTSQAIGGQNFLPDTKPAPVYGLPIKKK